MTREDPVSQYTGAFGNRSGPRSRGGCLTCRRKKVKCDETRPVCSRCARLSRRCDWESQPRKRPSRGASRKSDRVHRAVSPLLQPLSRSHRPLMVHRVPDLNDPEYVEEELNDNALILVAPSSQDAFTDAQALLGSIPANLLNPATGASASGLVMDEQCHEAVFMYTTRFAASVDTKHTAYSVPAVVLQTGASEPAVMHMILALGRQHLAAGGLHSETADERSVHSVTAMEHYGEALSLLGNMLPHCNSTRSLDVILATLWLTTIYEQRFSQRPMRAITAHLQGAVSVLVSANVTQVIQQREDEPPEPARHDIDLSYFGARLLVWLFGLDARATTFGHGGALNSALGLQFGLDCQVGMRRGWFRALSILHRISAPLFQVTWGSNYPMREILYDVKHKGMFDMFRDCGQLRLMAAEMRRDESPDIRTVKETAAQRKLKDLGEEYVDLFKMAAGLCASTARLEPELTITLCWVMPHYQASVLDILRVTGQNDPDHSDRLNAVQTIFKLALHGYTKEGAEAIVRVAWPLLMAGIETQDPFQQQWAIDRLKELTPFGKCYHPAALFLEKIQYGLREGDTCVAESIVEGLWSGTFVL